MKQFSLAKRTTNGINTVFHVLDAQNSVIGSINVSNEGVPDFLQKWRGLTDGQQLKASASASRSNIDPMVAVLMKPRTPMSRATLLRS